METLSSDFSDGKVMWKRRVLASTKMVDGEHFVILGFCLNLRESFFLSSKHTILKFIFHFIIKK